jgi:hypothetical protein
MSIGRVLVAEIKKNLKFGPDIYHFVFASICAQCTLATIFDFELSQKKVVSDTFEVHLNVSK